MLLHLPQIRGARDWAAVVRAEYDNCPGLALTKPQIQRLCGVDAATCAAVVKQLVDEHYLHAVQNGVLIHEKE
jgi:hypothetical protein